ncbi:hypothetical protein CCP4SC76_5000001 [Gammaproteobacteria bacterium]
MLGSVPGPGGCRVFLGVFHVWFVRFLLGTRPLQWAGGLSRIKAGFGVGVAGAQSGASALSGLRLCACRQS